MDLKSLFRPLFQSEFDELNQLNSAYYNDYITTRQRLEQCRSNDKKLKWFTSHRELRQWLFNNPVSERQYVSTSYDCDDFATALKLAAEADGYRIDIQWDLTGRFDPTGRRQPHALNSTKIGNYVYFIEPQTDAIVYEGVAD